VNEVVLKIGSLRIRKGHKTVLPKFNYRPIVYIERGGRMRKAAKSYQIMKQIEPFSFYLFGLVCRKMG